MATCRLLGQQLRSWGEQLLMLIVVLVVAIAWISIGKTLPGRGLEPDEGPGSGIDIRVEVVDIWLPVTLIDLARKPSASCVPQSHQELRTLLERSGQQNLWFALSTRHYQINGGVAVITYIRRPCFEPENFRELLNVLAIEAGNPLLDLSLFDSGCSVHILPKEMEEREPREVVDQLVGPQYSPSGDSREPRDEANDAGNDSPEES